MIDVYVAAPYADGNYVVRAERERLASAYAADLALDGVTVFSPLSHSRSIALRLGAGVVEPSYWYELDLEIAVVCSVLHVLTLPGWVESVGVVKEMEYFHYVRRPVHFVTHGPDGFELSKSEVR